MNTGTIFNLEKSMETVRFNLDKAQVPADVKAEVIVIMDVSSSFEHEHEEGTTSVLLERLVPLAKVLDPDGMFDFITFSDGPNSVQYLGSIDESNAKNYVVNKVVGRVRGWNGGTSYSYPLEEALRTFGWMPYDEGGQQPIEKPRFWDRLLGRTPEQQPTTIPAQFYEQKRSIVLFVTDGENDPGDRMGDKRRTKDVLRASQQRGDNIYFLFIGACEHQEFDYVEEIAREFKNTGIVMATDPEAFVELPDDQLINKLLDPELVAWLKQ